MSENIVLKKNFSKLKALTKGLKQKYVARVGILGAEDERTDDAIGNAEIGVVHEFGSVTNNIDSRSFLRMPITKKSKKIVKDVFKMRKKIAKEMARGNTKAMFEILAVAAEGQVLEAFATKGFGSWKPLDPRTIIRRKDKSDTPLIDTSQLRNSITSDVVKG